MSTRKSVKVSKAVTRISLLALLACLLASPLAAAKNPEPLAKVEAAADLLAFQPLGAYAEVRVTVSGPDGFEVVQTFAAGEAPIVDLPGADGFYKYELRFSPVFTEKERQLLTAARDAGTEIAEVKDAAKLTVQSGSFTVAGGSVVPDLRETEPDKVVLTNGDGVIRNSLCVGFDCPDAPVFSDSTMLMMENNTRIKFGDTSNAPFPNNDWEIEANSSLSGGANYLGFNDCGTADNDGGCATDLVFAVESGARQSALYVESDGDVGIGTSNPVLDLHIVTGNTPALRLDQDGSSGFTPQVWDLAGNETNFFVRDVTGGSRLPFRIHPGAPTSSIDIASDGDVGMGDSSPDASLDVTRSDGTTSVLIEETSTTATGRQLLKLVNNGAVRQDQQDTSTGVTWRLTNGATNFRLIDLSDAATVEFELQQDGDLIITGSITTGGATCGGGCDDVFDEDYGLPSIEEHAAQMWELGHLPAVGPTAPDVPMNITEKTGNMLNELEKAHIYIEQLNERLAHLEALLAEQEAQE